MTKMGSSILSSQSSGKYSDITSPPSSVSCNKHINKHLPMLRPEKRKSAEKARKSTKSVKEKRGYISTNAYLSSQTPQKEQKKDSISFMHSKSIRKNKFSSSNRRRSRSKDYLTPSKENDDIQHLVNRKTHKKLLKTKQSQEAAQQLITRNLAKQAIRILESGLLINPTSYEVNYFLGMCYLVNEQFGDALAIFKQQLLNHPKKNLFLLLAVCYKKLEDFESAQQLLNSCLAKYPKFYDGFVQRGRLYMKMRKFDKANHDFEEAILLNEDKWIAYVLKGDCLRKCNKFLTAIKMYNKAQKIQKSAAVILRKIFCNIQLQQYDAALTEINNLLAQQPKNAQLLFAKGLIYRKKQEYEEALMYFDQSLKNDFTKQMTARCIYEIGKIKVLQKDYHGALFVLSKSDKETLEHKQLLRLKMFCEGITYLMKENYSQGITTLNNLIKQYGITRFLTSLFYSCRAYGYMHLGKFQQARIDFLKLEKQQTLSIPNLYNKYICEGILSWNQRKCQQALAYFSKASKIIPNKLQPFYYKAVTLIEFVNEIMPAEADDKRKQYLLNALKIIRRQHNPSRKQSDLLLIKGLLQLYSKDIKNAINDINMVLYQRNISAVALYLKALILGQREIYDEAIEFLSEAIDADEAKQYPQLYLNRAKCYILTKDQKRAFNDLQEYVSHRMVSPDIHIWAAHFLFSIGAYEDAAKAYSNINNITKDREALQCRSYCYLASLNLAHALADMNAMVDLQDDKQVRFDAKYLEAVLKSTNTKQKGSSKQSLETVYENCIQSLKSAKKQCPGFGRIFTESDYKIIKGVLYFYCDNIPKAISNLQKGYRIQIKEGKNFRRRGGFQQNVESYFNLAICHVMNNNLIKTIKLLKEFNQKIEDQIVKQQVNVFISQLQQQIKAPFTSPEKNKPKHSKIIQLLPFPVINRLCSLYPKITLPLVSKISTRLYFDIPEVPIPEIHVSFDQKILESVNMKWITMRPQAPWVQRGQQGLILTDHIEEKYGEVYSESSEGEESRKLSSGAKEQDYNQFRKVQSHGEHSQEKDPQPQHFHRKYDQKYWQEDEERIIQVDSAPPFNPKKWAQEMKLGAEFEEKYQRAMKKNENR